MTSFTFGGTALTSFGRVTLIDDYLDTADRRGDNIALPYRHGTVFVPKYYDERKIIIGIAVIAATATALETSMDTMRKLFSVRTQQTLAMTLEDASVRNALASVDSRLGFERVSPVIARVTAEFTLTSPFFRGATLYEVTSDAIDGTPTPQTLTVVNGGTVEERAPTLLLTGALKNPVITNTTTGVSLTYTGTIAGGASVTIGETNGEMYATHSTSGNVIGNVTHSGSSALMTFNTGNNAVTIADADYAGGRLKVSYYPPYL
jgi:phage-related protein